MLFSFIYICFLCITTSFGAERNELYEGVVSGLVSIEDEEDLLPRPRTCTNNYVTNINFDCIIRRPYKAEPLSVHLLTPYDVSVVAAFGDSITAGFGADSCSLVSLDIEFRGRSWSIGGDDSVETILTIPNILKKYNPNLVGYSVGNGDETSNGTNFNMAEVGARAEHMPRQARDLIEKMRNHPDVHYQEDWKIVTLFIGGNDLCLHCRNENKYAVEQYTDYIRQTLDILHEEMPKTLVNVVGILRVEDLNSYRTPKCDIIHIAACSCVMFRQGEEEEKVEAVTKSYQDKVEELILSGRYDSKDDFTVVYQPFLAESGIPFLPNGDVDGTFFAPDCFHFSSRGHAIGAKELWKNMFQKVGGKSREWSPDDNAVLCPPQDFPYFFTNVNSGIYGASPSAANSTKGRSHFTLVVALAMVTELLWHH